MRHTKRGLNEGRISRADCDAIEPASRAGAAPPQNTLSGGGIFIHGSGSGDDWTPGCVALEDEDMAEIYGIVSIGNPLKILP